jgi:hypothetical protein
LSPPNYFFLLINKGAGLATHYGLAIYIKKYLKAKERIMEIQKYFIMQKKIIIFKKKKSSTRNLKESFKIS